INITGFKNSMADIKVFGGSNRGKKITISNVNIWNSSQDRGIAGGGGIYDLRIINANLQGQGTGNGLELYNNTAELVGVNAENYNNAAYITKKAYSVVPTAVRGGFSRVFTGADAMAPRSAGRAWTRRSPPHSARSSLARVGAPSHAHGPPSAVTNSLHPETWQGAYGHTTVNSRGVQSPGNYHFLLLY